MAKPLAAATLPALNLELDTGALRFYSFWILCQFTHFFEHLWCLHLATITVSYSGFVPTLDELKGFLKDSRTPEDNWVPLKNTSARSVLKKTLSQKKIKSNTTLSTSNGENIEDLSMNSGTPGRRIMNSMFASENSLEVRGGTDITLDALAAYLRYLEGTGNASWQE